MGERHCGKEARLLTDVIKEYGEEIGLDIVKITSAELLVEAAARIEDQIRNGLIPAEAHWKIEEVNAFCDPRSVIPKARSVVVAAECYLTSEPEDLTKPGEPHGKIARYTWRNYYRDVSKKLKKLAAFLRRRVRKDMQYKCYSCGPLAEKPMAERAAIGWYGKHGVIMAEEYSSWLVLGELITDLELEPDEPLEIDCGDCQLCIEACPTRAILSPYILEREKCLQYLTNWRGMIPVPYRELWGSRLYGCTTCQDVCPLNIEVKPKERKPEIGHIGSSVPLIPLLEISEEEYRARFRHNQVGARWVRRECIQRNAAIALGNIGDPVAVASLVRTLESPNPMLKGHVAWALGKIGGKRAKQALERARPKESDSTVRKEIEGALSA